MMIRWVLICGQSIARRDNPNNPQDKRKDKKMKKSDYEKMVNELKTVYEPHVYKIDEDGATLIFSIDTSEDDVETQEGPGADMLDEINSILKKYGAEADWNGGANGEHEDAECKIAFESDDDCVSDN